MPSDHRELVFLVNGQSRSGALQGETAKQALEQAGFFVKSFLLTDSNSDFESKLQSFVRSGEPLVGIGGGDGTQRIAAQILCGTDSAMAVLPLGTGNALASDLGIPSNLEEAAKALFSAEVTAIDLGLANGFGFVNVATCGLTGLIEKNIPKGLKGKFGRLVYLPAVVLSLKQLRPFELRVVTDGDDYVGMALQFVAAAGRTHAGHLKVTRHSSNTDGRLSLYALDSTDGRGLAKFGVGLLTGLHPFLNEVWTSEVVSAEVHTSPRKGLILDGERMGKTPIQLRVRPQSLKVLIPIPAPVEQP